MYIYRTLGSHTQTSRSDYPSIDSFPEPFADISCLLALHTGRIAGTKPTRVMAQPTRREIQTIQFSISSLTVPLVPSRRIHCEFALALQSIQALNWKVCSLCILCDSYSWFRMLINQIRESGGYSRQYGRT